MKTDENFPIEEMSLTEVDKAIDDLKKEIRYYESNIKQDKRNLRALSVQRSKMIQKAGGLDPNAKLSWAKVAFQQRIHFKLYSWFNGKCSLENIDSLIKTASVKKKINIALAELDKFRKLPEEEAKKKLNAYFNGQRHSKKRW